MANSTTRLPKRGDIVARKLSDNSEVYFVKDDFSQSSLTADTYEVLGAVAWRFHDQVLWVFLKQASRKWLARWQWTLTVASTRTGTGTFTIMTSSTASTTLTVSYSTTATTSEIVSTLNDVFHQNVATNKDGQRWYAFESNNTIQIQCDCNFYQQYSGNTAGGDFTITGNNAPGVSTMTNMLRKNGGIGAYGACACLERYVYYYGSQAEVALSQEASVKTTSTPMSKATYTASGNQQYLTNCIAKYGSGEAGWLNYIKSCKPVRETDYGVHGTHSGKELGATLGAATYTYNDGTTTTTAPLYPAHNYCYNLANIETSLNLQTISAGDLWLPTPWEGDYIFQDILYGVPHTPSYGRDDDELNSGLNKISGSTAINMNGSYSWWLSIRSYAFSTWYVYGYDGNFPNLYFNYSLSCLPVSLSRIK